MSHGIFCAHIYNRIDSECSVWKSHLIEPIELSKRRNCIYRRFQFHIGETVGNVKHLKAFINHLKCHAINLHFRDHVTIRWYNRRYYRKRSFSSNQFICSKEHSRYSFCIGLEMAFVVKWGQFYSGIKCTNKCIIYRWPNSSSECLHTLCSYTLCDIVNRFKHKGMIHLTRRNVLISMTISTIFSLFSIYSSNTKEHWQHCLIFFAGIVWFTHLFLYSVCDLYCKY